MFATAVDYECRFVTVHSTPVLLHQGSTESKDHHKKEGSFANILGDKN